MVEPTIVCDITEKPIIPDAMRKSAEVPAACGGGVTFEGIIRDHNHGREVTKLEYEAYDALALKELQRICLEAADRYGLEYVRAVHRKGELQIGELAVIVQVFAHHRGEAFAGCRYVIDQLKQRLPIWKKEHYAEGDTSWTRCSEHQHHDDNKSPHPLYEGATVRPERTPPI